jgi:hypothetical protein
MVGWGDYLRSWTVWGDIFVVGEEKEGNGGNLKDWSGVIFLVGREERDKDCIFFPSYALLQRRKERVTEWKRKTEQRKIDQHLAPEQKMKKVREGEEG